MPTDATAARYEAAKLKLRLSEVLHAELERIDTNARRLAAAAGLKEQTVRDILAGMSDPSLSRVLALESALGRPAGWIARKLAK